MINVIMVVTFNFFLFSLLSWQASTRTSVHCILCDSSCANMLNMILIILLITFQHFYLFHLKQCVTNQMNPLKVHISLCRSSLCWSNIVLITCTRCVSLFIYYKANAVAMPSLLADTPLGRKEVHEALSSLSLSERRSRPQLR